MGSFFRSAASANGLRGRAETAASKLAPYTAFAYSKNCDSAGVLAKAAKFSE